MKKQLFSLRKLPRDCVIRGHFTCKAMPVLPVNKVVDKKTILGKTWRAE
jgi:hypothetical protein